MNRRHFGLSLLATLQNAPAVAARTASDPKVSRRFIAPPGGVVTSVAAAASTTRLVVGSAEFTRGRVRWPSPNSGLHLYDIADPGTPRWLGFAPVAGAGHIRLSADGRLAAVRGGRPHPDDPNRWQSQIVLVDLHRDSGPRVVSTVTPGSYLFDLSSDGTLLATDEGMFSIEPPEPGEGGYRVTQVASFGYETLGEFIRPLDIAFSDADRLLIIGHYSRESQRAYVLDVSLPSAPTILPVSRSHELDHVEDVQASIGNLAFLSTRETTRIVELGRRYVAVRYETVRQTGGLRTVFPVSGRPAFVDVAQGHISRLRFYDVADPTSPRITYSLTLPGYVKGLAFSADRSVLYVGLAESTLAIIQFGRAVL